MLPGSVGIEDEQGMENKNLIKTTFSFFPVSFNWGYFISLNLLSSLWVLRSAFTKEEKF